jgi:uncharacterized lipoprotein YddW (UPF0748 family)
MCLRALTIFFFCAIARMASGAGTEYQPSLLAAPAVQREFRGAWVASVNNIDWPSRPGLSSEQQKAELVAILDRATQLRLNALLFQVRPACDAFYFSRLEPWSEYLTGQMGRAPSPFYDPLQFAIEEAHKRGLELHAWFNPFRARHSTALSSASPTHFSRIHPELVLTYGREMWLDPGQRQARDHSLQVILDVVRRYDIDGVHLDDYFYPYPEKLKNGKQREFPDHQTYKTYLSGGGRLALADWRRENINRFVQDLYNGVKAEKKTVKVGISPFGIWRPGFPPKVNGLDSYNELYADSRKWLAQGWLDYFTPQLYWPIDAREQSFPVLLKWWAEQNIKQRHLWPGDAVSRVGSTRPAGEIIDEVRATRRQAGATGNAHWSFKALLQNRVGITEMLQREVYAKPALVPASPWLDAVPPAQPRLQVSNLRGGTSISWRGIGEKKMWLWVLQLKTGPDWSTEILAGSRTNLVLNFAPDAVSLFGVDRCGNASSAVVLEAGKGKLPAGPG